MSKKLSRDPCIRRMQICFLSVDKENENSLVMVEEWDSKEHHQNYVAFRETDGTSDFMDPLLKRAPRVRYLDITDA